MNLMLTLHIIDIYIVDAKSIVGVLGLDFNQTLTVSYTGYDADFEQFMKRFAVAC